MFFSLSGSQVPQIDLHENVKVSCSTSISEKLCDNHFNKIILKFVYLITLQGWLWFRICNILIITMFISNEMGLISS